MFHVHPLIFIIIPAKQIESEIKTVHLVVIYII